MFEKSIKVLTFFVGAWIIVTGYNVDTIDGIKLFIDPDSSERSRPSYFGFSTALLSTTAHGRSASAFVLVGTPRANVSAIPSVVEPGTVYKCGVNDGVCTQWNPDTCGNGPFLANNGSMTNQVKNNSWIGATLGVQTSTGMPHPRVVVCAPRWKNYHKEHGWLMNGLCYSTVVQSEEAFDKPMENRLFPLFNSHRQTMTINKIIYHDYGLGQTGISLHLYADNNRSDILLGNPGVYNWNGVPLLKKSGSDLPIVPYIGRETSILSGDYFGYSVSSGFYMRKGERLYASGAPRAAAMFGRVLIFEFPGMSENVLDVKTILDGQQHGEYFGASLGSCDVDNDGIDEIFVGAPLWSRYVDEGRVYVYRSERNNKFVPHHLEGEVVGGRFGSVMTCLGDLDHDGYGDIAVGAPYENDNGGAIYVYNGSPTGLAARYSQRVTGHSASRDIRGFGGAISEPLDVDGNAYVDIAVGAYLSGHVVLLRSRPVVTIRVTIGFNGAAPLLQTNTTCFTVNVCSFYDGFRAPSTLKVEKTLIVDPMEGRAYCGSGERTANGEYKLPDILRRGLKICDELLINVERDADNVIEPMEISVSLSVASPPKAPRNFCAECPVVNGALSKTNDTMRIPYAVDCGPDNVCTSNLEVTVTTDNVVGTNEARYTLGSKSTVRLIVRVVNRGESAYNARVDVFVPSPIFIGRIPPECADPNTDSRSNGVFRITCTLGNPLRNESKSLLELDMSGVTTLGETGKIVIHANVSTRSININAVETMTNFTINLDVDADIAIAGKSQQDVYSYLDKDQPQPLLNIITFQHIYQVQMLGQSPIERSVVTISVPTRIAAYIQQKHPTKNNTKDETSIAIARVNKTFGIMGGKKLNCTITAGMDVRTRIRIDLSIDARHNQIRRTNVPPENRTVYLNCTNPDVVECAEISCELPIFAESLTIAKLAVSIDLQLRNLSPETMSARDIIYFVSNGSVRILQPSVIVDHIDNKNVAPDSTFVGTTFVGSPIASSIAVWIIVMSVLVGILFLVLLTLGLIKLGFFRRSKKEQLEALKAESDNHGFVLETTSSAQNLDGD